MALLLDECAASLATEMCGRKNVITSHLQMQYRRRLSTPAIVLCRAWAGEDWENRKIMIEATIEDGEDGVFAKGFAVYVNLAVKL